jgi:flavodoxin
VKAVVVYYSRYGHTTKVAEALAQELEAETRRIEETKKRGFIGMGRGSVTDARFEIEPMDLDLSEYDTVVLCTPIWAGKPACPVRTFVHDARLEGKKVHVLFSTSGGDIDKAVETIGADLARKNATVGLTGKLVTGGLCRKGAPDEELRQAGREFARKVKGAGS